MPGTLVTLDGCWQALPGRGRDSLGGKVHMQSLGLVHFLFVGELWPMGVAHFLSPICPFVFPSLSFALCWRETYGSSKLVLRVLEFSFVPMKLGAIFKRKKLMKL